MGDMRNIFKKRPAPVKEPEPYKPSMSRFTARLYSGYVEVWIDKDDTDVPYGVYARDAYQRWPFVHVEAGAYTEKEALEKLEKLKRKIEEARKAFAYYEAHPIVRQTVVKESV